jgi:glycosyltransferase involved in cell wall biosynthesis
MLKPFISICIPNHNYENYIKETVDSVLAQSYTNFEIIIVDDVSTDKSVEIIKSYKDPRIKLYQNSSNLYTFKTNNKALSLAKGELVAILHSDDKYEPTFLEEIVKAYNQHPNHKVFITGVHFYHPDDKKLIPWHPYNSGGVKSQKEILVRLFHQNNIGNGVNVVFHNDCIKKIGGFSTEYKYIADYDYFLRLANNYDFVYIDKLLTYYRVHNSSATNDNIKQSDRGKEGNNIISKNLSKCSVIPKKFHKELFYFEAVNIIHKSLYTGIRYKSGELTRSILNQAKKNYSRIVFAPYWHLIYLISFLINNNLSKLRLTLVSFLGKLILYPHKVYINNALEKFIKKI